MSGPISCAIAVIAFCCLYLLLGFGQRKGAEVTGTFLVCFGAATLLSAISAAGLLRVQYSPRLVLIGALIGGFAGLGFLATMLAIRAGVPVAVVGTVISLSLALPVVLGLVLYKEVPSVRQALGLALTVLAIVLIQGKPAVTEDRA
jgi:drug/metabolite transporter (DMT)-like permease